MTAQPKHKYTLEEYLEIERNSEKRYESIRVFKFE